MLPGQEDSSKAQMWPLQPAKCRLEGKGLEVLFLILELQLSSGTKEDGIYLLQLGLFLCAVCLNLFPRVMGGALPSAEECVLAPDTLWGHQLPCQHGV